METLAAYRDHGHPAARLEAGIEAAHETLAGLAQLGIDLQALADQLEREGVAKFVDAFDRLLDKLARRIPVPVA
jgi:transaldolase